MIPLCPLQRGSMVLSSPKVRTSQLLLADPQSSCMRRFHLSRLCALETLTCIQQLFFFKGCLNQSHFLHKIQALIATDFVPIKLNISNNHKFWLQVCSPFASKWPIVSNSDHHLKKVIIAFWGITNLLVLAKSFLSIQHEEMSLISTASVVSVLKIFHFEPFSTLVSRPTRHWSAVSDLKSSRELS